MTTEKKEKIVEELVRQYANQDSSIKFYTGILSSYEHIIEMGTTLLMHKWGLVDYQTGSFVRNFLNNDLEATFASADSVNVKAIYFYLRLVNNVGMPRILINEVIKK